MATTEEVKIIYESEGVVVVDKPAGMVTTKENYELRITNDELKNKNIYLEDWVNDFFPNDLPRKGIVHRLDKGTSGLVVVAKTEAFLKKLKAMFKERKVHKTYLALVSGSFPFEAEIQMPIKRSNYGFEKFSVSEEGKTAWTIAKLKQKYRKDGKIYSLLVVDLKTGRTHQIRVHLSYLRYPIVGDRLYGGEMLLDRPFLHAWKLKMVEPTTKKELNLESKLPTELENFLADYEKMD